MIYDDFVKSGNPDRRGGKLSLINPGEPKHLLKRARAAAYYFAILPLALMACSYFFAAIQHTEGFQLPQSLVLMIAGVLMDDLLVSSFLTLGIYYILIGQFVALLLKLPNDILVRLGAVLALIPLIFSLSPDNYAFYVIYGTATLIILWSFLTDSLGAYGRHFLVSCWAIFLAVPLPG